MSRATNRKMTGKNRCEPHSVSVETLVESYLGTVGIGESQDGKVFRERLGKTHGPIGEQVAAAVSAREAGEDVNVYVLKNRTLRLSLDVTSQYCSQMYREFMSWFLRQTFTPPQCVLDVGCDNGVLTCFFATQYPEAEVVGVDRCAEGIACARELGRRLNLANVRFEIRDLLTLDSVFPDEFFDLIISSTVFHEVLEIPDPDNVPGPTRTTTVGGEDSRSVRAATDLARLLRLGRGVWVSVERWPDAARLAWWMRVLNQAGLGIVADQSTLLTFSNMDGEQEALPIVVAARHRWTPIRSDNETLAGRLFGHGTDEEDRTISPHLDGPDLT